MAIKEALQRGNQVSIKHGNSICNISGTLIGFTANTVFIKNGRNLQFIVEKGGSVGGSGTNISLYNNEDVIMFGNKVGAKRGSTIYFYDEKGKPAGTRQA